MPEHYEPAINPRAEHRAPDLLALTGRFIARQLTTRRPVWAVLAVTIAPAIAWSIAFGATGKDSLSVGPTRVEAASESSGNPRQLPTPTADARLQSGYVTAVPNATPQAAGTGGPVLPSDAAPDDGAPPSWLSRELSPYWGTIAAAAAERGIDSHWLGIVAMVENPQALADTVTFDGGHGLAQIQRATAVVIQAATGLPCVDGWADPATSYRCGAWYLKGALDNGADLALPGDAEPVLLMGVAGYNSGWQAGIDSAITAQLRAALTAGVADPCSWIGNEFTRRYCYSARDMWAQSVAERATVDGPPADAPAAGPVTPFRFTPRVAPGAPDHLEVLR